MALSFLYLMARRLVDVLLGSLRSEHAKDVEIAVLRHQLSVLRRQVKRAEFRPADSAVLAVLARALPRAQWSTFLVTPGTVLLGNGLRPAPRRASVTWRAFLRAQASRHRGHGLLHRGDPEGEDAVRAVLHRTWDAVGSARRCHAPPERALGGAAGPGTLDGAAGGHDHPSVPDPRP